MSRRRRGEGGERAGRRREKGRKDMERTIRKHKKKHTKSSSKTKERRGSFYSVLLWFGLPMGINQPK